MAYTSPRAWRRYISTCIDSNGLQSSPPALSDILAGKQFLVQFDEQEFRWASEGEQGFCEEESYSEAAEDYDIRIYKGDTLSKFVWTFRLTDGRWYRAIVYDHLPDHDGPIYLEVFEALKAASQDLRPRAELEHGALRRDRPSTERLVIPSPTYPSSVPDSSFSHEASLMYFYPWEIITPSCTGPVALSPTSRLATRLSSRRLNKMLCVRCRVGNVEDTEETYDYEHSVARQWYHCMCERDIPSCINPSGLEDCVAKFVANIKFHHTNFSTLFAAAQSFVITDGYRSVVVGLLAVLREHMDARDPTNTDSAPADVKADIIVDFTILNPVDNVNVLNSWLDVQILGSHFSTERQKRAAWALGQLSSSSYRYSDENFVWIRQDYSNDLELRSGRRKYLNLLPGPPDAASLPELKKLKLILYHPGNAGMEFELMAKLHGRLRQACIDSVQDWLLMIWMVARGDFAVIEERIIPTVLAAYRDYLWHVVGHQTDAMVKAGHHTALHACMGDECDHPRPSFEDIRDGAREILETLFSLLTSATEPSNRPMPHGPSWRCMKLAYDLGELLFHFQASYILLQPHVKILHDKICRHHLNSARKKLENAVRPAPTLIWNYLTDEMHALASRQRAEYYAPYSASFISLS